MRDLREVINQMLVVMEQSEFRGKSEHMKHMESFKSRYSYSAPEIVETWWEILNEFIFCVLISSSYNNITHTKFYNFNDMNEFEKKIMVIWTNKSEEQLLKESV